MEVKRIIRIVMLRMAYSGDDNDNDQEVMSMMMMMMMMMGPSER